MFAVARQDLPQFAGKAVTGRAVAYPLAAFLLPAVWWFLSRRRRIYYPYALDILIVLPFLIDTAGNAANLHDTIDVTFIRHSNELRTAYADTLGDLALGLSGPAVAAALTARLLWRGRAPETAPVPVV